MFTHGLKSMASIPSTQCALFQHAKRNLNTAGFVWKQSLSRIPKIPNPCQWLGQGMECQNQTSGYHIEQICQTSARLARCSSTVGVLLPVRVTASAIELNFVAVHCASVKGAALTMTMKYDVHTTLFFGIFCSDTFIKPELPFSLNKTNRYNYDVITKICVW